MSESVRTAEELWEMFFGIDRTGQLRICQQAIDASNAASKCLASSHEIEIDNLRRTIVDLSAALLASVNGGPVDPVMVRAAENAVQQELATPTI